MQLLFAVDATGCAGKFPSQKLGIPSRAVGVRRRRQTDFCQSRLRLDKLSTAQMDEREETDHLVRSAKPTPLGSFPSALIHEASRAESGAPSSKLEQLRLFGVLPQTGSLFTHVVNVRIYAQDCFEFIFTTAGPDALLMLYRDSTRHGCLSIYLFIYLIRYRHV